MSEENSKQKEEDIDNLVMPEVDEAEGTEAGEEAEDRSRISVGGSESDESEQVIYHPRQDPLESFQDPRIPQELASFVSSTIGWNAPTPIQALCLPYTLKGRDVAGFAQTGTGKTGVFLITVAQRIKTRKPKPLSSKASPYAVVLAPTRELAVQIEDECKKFLLPLNLKTLSIYGGTSWEEQAKLLTPDIEVIVATPGRLKDFFQKDLVALDQVGIFICDEVDRMFDMGFVEDVEYFLTKLQENTQRLVFSATTNDKVKELAFEYLNHPEYIFASQDEVAPESIDQHVLICETENKFRILLGLMREHNPERAIIFANTKLTANWLQYKLTRNGIESEMITGDLPQSKRINLIERIKQGKIKALVATDVASRGLHISGVSHVYNFDIPEDPANYIHRIGRTARAGAKGSSYSLLCEEYANSFIAIKDLLGEAAPKSRWYDESYLQVEDLSGNPFEDNFGKPMKVPSHHEEYGRRRPRFEREERRPNREKPKQSWQELSAEPVPKPQGIRSIFSLIKRFFLLLFPFMKKKEQLLKSGKKEHSNQRRNFPDRGRWQERGRGEVRDRPRGDHAPHRNADSGYRRDNRGERRPQYSRDSGSGRDGRHHSNYHGGYKGQQKRNHNNDHRKGHVRPPRGR